MALNNIPGAFASLSSGLLARKGAAKPAMRPQGFGQMGASLDDLGWNDMGFEAPKPSVGLQERDANHDAFGDAVPEQPLRNPVAALTPSPVHGQQADLAARLAEADDVGEPDEDEDEGFGDMEVAPVTTPQPVLRVSKSRATAVSVKPRPAAPAVRATPGSGTKAAFTLRLDADRHLRLRLACALTGRSAQMLVTDAVDRLIADYPELDTFADTLPKSGGSRRAKG